MSEKFFEENDDNPSSSVKQVKEERPSGLFAFMSAYPAPFLLILPIVFVVLTGIGWSNDSKVEDDVSAIWVPTSGNFFKDKEYMTGIEGDEVGPSGVIAMAISREEGGNIFTEKGLNEITKRMQEVEKTQVSYKGHTFTMKDVCAASDAGVRGSTYQFPCARLSPMDLFLETRWSFDESDKLTWYSDLMHPILVRPRIPRFGILRNFCTSDGANADDLPDALKPFLKGSCDHDFMLRMNATYAVENGKAPDYASPITLMSDIGNFEMNYPCKICIEEMYDGVMEQMTAGTEGMFKVLMFYLGPMAQDVTHPNQGDALQLLGKVQKALATVNRASIEEFWMYFVTRTLYAELGGESYVKNYAAAMNAGSQEGLHFACVAMYGGDATKCPPPTISLDDARKALLRHADNSFSSINTGGNPFPFWDENAANMFVGDLPVGGSGIDMSGTPNPLNPTEMLNTPLQGTRYLDLENFGKPGHNPFFGVGTFNPFDPSQDPTWSILEKDPVYVWFMAGVTEVSASCNNNNIGGTNTGVAELDAPTGFVAANFLSSRWCTKYNEPTGTDEPRTMTYFAKMWYDLLIDSDPFLGIRQGEDDPYSFTTGQGCGYDLTKSRDSYSNKNTTSILHAASRELYYIDEGESIGALDRNLLIGDSEPPVGEYNFSNPLERVGVIQNLHFFNIPSKIVDRVKNCNRPDGPIEDLSEEDAKEVLKQFKKKFEDNWSEDWDNENEGSVQFVGFIDDAGAEGTTQRTLNDVTLSGGTLMAVSFVIIALFSVIFLFSFDVIESKVLVTIVGVCLVILCFFGALGTAIMAGIKLNICTSWTLPFIMVGIGVDDMYIVLLALKGNRSFERGEFVKTMKHVVIPVTMTSTVNFFMFSVMNISDIPGVYKTAQAAMISVAFLWLAIIFCFPAYCYLDMKRQEAGRADVFFCIKKNGGGEVSEAKSSSTDNHSITGCLYNGFYKPLMIKEGLPRMITHIFVLVATLALLGVSIYGATKGEVGLGLEDFFPSDSQAGEWARHRTDHLASWPIRMNWGAVDYTNPNTQMKMIWQFEQVVDTKHVAEVETKSLWIADFAVWTTRQCDENFQKRDPMQPECGMDLVYPGDNSTCEGTWMPNTLGLREKTFITEPCQPREGGVCRPTSQMHFLDMMTLSQTVEGASGIKSWCPVFDGWSEDKLKFCVEKWRDFTGGGGNLPLVDDTATENPECKGEFFKDDEIVSPIPLSKGPGMFGIDLFTHEDTVDLIEETRVFCDDYDEVHCWLTGIPFDYWEQYTTIYDTLYKISGVAVAVGFGVASLFLFIKINFEPYHDHSVGEVFAGSLAGGFIIAVMCALSVITVIGLSSLAGVNLTAFSVMSYVLSVGFAVEYSVHVTHRWLTAPLELKSAQERVKYSMSFLFLPTFMSFISSTIGVVCLAITKFEFNKTFFFKPLLIVMFVTYFFGVFSLPVLLSKLNFGFLQLGHYSPEFSSDEEVDEEGPSDQPPEESAVVEAVAE